MIRFKVNNDPVLMTLVLQKHFQMKVVPQKHFKMKVESAVKVGTSGQVYDGSYDITPTVDGLTVETKDKYMLEDVDVNPIPFFSVGNTSGGNTVYIGSEVLINGN